MDAPASGGAKPLGISELARFRKSHVPDGTYDHGRQQLKDWVGGRLTTSTGDEDSGGSTTFWDGEKS